MKQIVRLTESDIHRMIKDAIQEIIRLKTMLLHEGLIKSYDMDDCKDYIIRTFPNIKKIVSLKNNPYDRKYKYPIKHNDFVGIELDVRQIQNYKDISQKVQELLGWFTSCVTLRVKVQKGRIEYQFNKFGDKYIYQKKDKTEIELDEFLSYNPQLTLFYLVAEAKFGEVYQQQPDEIFYHVTESDKANKILQNGLCPKSYGNYPERIYLGKSITDIQDMISTNLNQMVLFQVDVSDLNLFKLYRDQRNATAVYTYDNIPPNKLKFIGNVV